MNFHGENFIGHTNSPLWWDYKYGITVVLGKTEVKNFSGKSDSASSDSCREALSRHKGVAYLSRKEFLRLWEVFKSRVASKTGEEPE